MRYAIPLVVCASILTVAKDATAQSYTVYPLQPAIQGGAWFDPVPFDMNNALQIVLGRLLWDGSLEARRLPIPDGLLNKVHINNAGLIAGSRELGPGRSELFTIENGIYRVRDVPLLHPILLELTDSGDMLVSDRANGMSFIVRGSQIQRLDDPATDMNEAGALAQGNTVRLPSGRRVQMWPEPWPIHEIGGKGQAVGGECGFGCTALYGRPDGSTVRHRFPDSPAGINAIWSHMNRLGEAAISVQSRIIFYRFVINFVYRDGPIIDLNAVMREKGWLVCETAGITDQGAILAVAIRVERIGNACEAVLLYPDPPATPQNFVANVSGRTVTLTWTSGADVRGHILEVGSASGASNLLRMSLGEQPSLTTSAPPGRYYVRIRAVNGVATSAPSAEVVVDVP